MKNDGHIEVLLLLCCLVGAIAFLCFATCAAHLAIHVLPDEKNLPDPAAEDLAAKAADLEQRVTSRREEIARREAELPDPATIEPSPQPAELAELETRLAELRALLEKARAEQAAAESSRDELEQRLKALTAAIAELEETLKAKRAEIEAIPDSPDRSTPFDDQVNKLRDELDLGKKELAQLEKELKRKADDKTLFNPRRNLSGMDKFRNPVYVDLTQSKVIAYPGKVETTVVGFDSDDDFLENIKGHDVIVLLVRPAGFDQFADVYDTLEQLNIPIVYEPLETAMRLDFSSEGQTP